jgi:hypothetical protein
MASDLDTFVLQYKTDLTDSLGRLERLQKKMDSVDKSGSKAGKGLKQFATGAAGELDKMIPGIGKLTSAVSGLGAEFAVAGTAVAALAIGIRAVMDLQSQFNMQRAAGMQLGVSGLRIENYQRAFANGSGGMVSRDAALEGVKRLSQMSNEAFTDPSGMKRAQLQHFLGVSPGSYGNPTGLNDEMRQMSGFLQGKSSDQVKGIAKATGFSQDWLLTLQKLGPSIGDITQLTTAEITARKQSEDSLAKFNDELGKFRENINELEISLGQNLLPAAEKFVGWVTKIVNAMNKATKPNAPTPGKIVNGHFVPDQPSTAAGSSTGKGHFGPGHTWIADAPTVDQKQAAAQTAEAAKKEQASASKVVDGLDESNKIGAQTAAQTALSMNLFAAAVSTFSGAVDKSQGWASWAGNIGAAAGLNGSSNAPVPGGNSGSKGLLNKNPGNLVYGAFAKAHGATGTDGRFAIFPTMEAGVAAHAALLDSNYYAKGLDTPRKIIGKYAPASEAGNNTPAYLSYLKSKGFDPDKPITDKAGFNAAQMAFESGYGSGKGIGQGKPSLLATDVLNKVAGYIGVDPAMLARGDVSKNDASVAISSLEADAIRTVQTGNQRLQNPIGLQPQQIADLKNNILIASRFLGTMEANKQAIIDSQKGDTNLTRGKVTPPVVVNASFNIIGTNMDAKQIANEVNRILAAHMAAAVNNMTNGAKG